MRHCTKCNVNIENDITNCPLCMQITEKTDGEFEKDFPIKPSKSIGKSRIASRVMFFVYMSFLVIYLIINFTEGFNNKWFMYSLIPVTYAYFITNLQLKYRKNIGLTVIANVLLLSTILFVSDKMTGNYKWAINYAIPFLILLGIIILISVSAGRVYFKDYITYIFVISMLGIGMFLFVLLNVVTIKWPSLITILVSIIQVIGMFTFVNKKTKDELKKRFHIVELQ